MPDPLPLVLTAAQCREVDRLAIAAGIAGLTLMENAGRGCTEWLLAHRRPQRVLILCGPGNNGGDGLVIARRLIEASVAVRVLFFGAEPRTADARANWDRLANRERWVRTVTAAEETRAALAADLPPDVVVDSIYGTGYTPARPLGPAFAAALDALRRHRPPCVLAVDVPSGLDADSGAADPATLPADVTLTFVARKPAMQTDRGRALCGEVVVVDIGVPAAVLRQVIAGSPPSA